MRNVRKIKRVYEYYVKDIDKWLTERKLKEYLDNNFIDYEDWYINNISDTGEYPICNCEGCDNKCKFKGFRQGYSVYCSNSCRSKSNHTLETQIRNYGLEEGTRRFNEIRKNISKAHTLDGFINKYGEEEGTKRFNSRSEKFSHSITLEGRIEKYGVEEGIRKDKEYHRNLSVSGTLEGYINKYGEEDGIRKFNEYRKKVGFSNTLDGYIQKYGEDEGNKKYREYTENLSYSLSLEGFLERYGEDEGIIRYNKYIDGKLNHKNNIRYHSVKTDKYLNLKSSYEVRYCKFLDSCEEIYSYEYESIRIQYEYEGKKRVYIPDFKIETEDGNIVIVEIKPDKFIDSEIVQAKMKALNDYIKENNLDWNTAWISEKDLDALESGRYTYKTILGDIIYTNETLKI